MFRRFAVDEHLCRLSVVFLDNNFWCVTVSSEISNTCGFSHNGDFLWVLKMVSVFFSFFFSFLLARACKHRSIKIQYTDSEEKKFNIKFFLF